MGLVFFIGMVVCFVIAAFIGVAVRADGSALHRFHFGWLGMLFLALYLANGAPAIF